MNAITRIALLSAIVCSPAALRPAAVVASAPSWAPAAWQVARVATKVASLGATALMVSEFFKEKYYWSGLLTATLVYPAYKPAMAILMAADTLTFYLEKRGIKLNSAVVWAMLLTGIMASEEFNWSWLANIHEKLDITPTIGTPATVLLMTAGVGAILTVSKDEKPTTPTEETQE